MNIDVIIAGAGPVGALLAAELGLAGVSTVVLERLAEPSGHSKAFGLNARTLDLLDRRGLLERFTAGRRTWPGIQFAGLDPWLTLDRTRTDHPYGLAISQADTESILTTRAAELGVPFRRGHTIHSARQDADSVTVDVTGPHGDYQLRGRYLVGCDGAQSTVRTAAGIGYPGTGGTAVCRLGDVVLDDPDALPPGAGPHWRTATGLLFCAELQPGVHRVVTTEFGAARAPSTLDELRASLRRVCGSDLGAHSATWLSVFTDAARLADRYRDGRILLAGDAAHSHFPIGGQGLNLGLQDAVNLGWKLAAEVRGTARLGCSTRTRPNADRRARASSTTPARSSR